MVRNKSPVKFLALLLCMAILMSMCMVSVAVNAVSGSQVAADGTYYSTLTGYKEGKFKYSATLGVEVKNGIITSLEISNATDSKMFRALTPQLINAYTEIEASISAVNAVEEDSSAVDVISSSTVSSSYSSSSKYSVNLKEAIIAALGTAQPRSDSSATGTVYSGSATVGSYSLKINVSVSNGKISAIEVDDSSTGNWSTVLSTAQSNYVGKTISDADSAIDAVSSATQYTAAFNTAVKSALSNAPAASSGSSGSSADGSGSSSSGTAITTYTGNGSTQNITIKVGETIKLVSSYDTSSYRQWTTSEWSGDTQLYTDDDDGNGNTITVTGKSVGTQTYRYYGYWLSINSEEFVITVEKASSDGGSGSSGSGSGSSGSGGSGGESSTTPPDHVKSISGSGNDYTISLNVTGKDVTESTSTTTPGTGNSANIVLVVDVSGSISGTKLTNLNSAIRTLVSNIPSGSQVGIVTFNSSVLSSQVYTSSQATSISISNTGGETDISPAITSAYNLLNTSSQWQKSGNSKIMVVISDGMTDNVVTTFKNAKSAKDNGVKIYTVNVASAVSTPSPIQGYFGESFDSMISGGQTDGDSLMQYISSNYSSYTLNTSFFSSSISGTSGNPDNGYALSSISGDFSTLFDGIKTKENITTTTTTLHTKNVVIKDTLSDYVELSNTNSSQNYGVTVTGLSSNQYSVSVSGKVVTVTFGSNVELTDGTTYTVNIPVKPTAQAQQEANSASADTSTFPSNAGAVLTYSYGDNDKKDVAYAEEPTITVNKQVALTRQRIVVKKEWGEGTKDTDKKPVTVDVKLNGTTVTQITLNSGNNWQATYETTASGTLTVKETAINGDPNAVNNYTVTGESTPSDKQLSVKDETVDITSSSEMIEGKYYVFYANQGNSSFYLYANASNQVAAVSSYSGNYIPDSYYWRLVKVNGYYRLQNKATQMYISSQGVENKSARNLVSSIGTSESNAEKNTRVDLNDTSTLRIYSTKTNQYRHLFANSAGSDTILNAAANNSTFVIKEAKATPTVDIYTYTITNTPKKFTVTWIDEDGTVLETDENVLYGTTPTYDGDEPEKAATAQYTYEFTGWTPEITPVTGDVTYKAVYTPTLRKYTVTWKDWDGEVLETDKNVPYGTPPSYDGDKPEKAEDSEYTYEFVGWSETPNGDQLDSLPLVTEDVTYYAVYEKTEIPAPPLTGVTSEKTTAYVITGISLLAAGAYFAAVRRKRRKVF